jgi:hypothetical protein
LGGHPDIVGSCKFDLQGFQLQREAKEQLNQFEAVCLKAYADIK